jgi:spermidine synthase
MVSGDTVTAEDSSSLTSSKVGGGIKLAPSDSASTLIKNGWFSETEAMWPGQKMCLEVEEVLINGRSSLQDVLMFKSMTYGNVLVLDGVIQVTQRDEHSYQEMITNLPMFAHPGPKKVLIVGGGDGGVAREVLKHKDVEEVVMCEIDAQVCEVSKVYLPNLSAGAFDDPRLKLIIDDAAKYLREEGPKQAFDVIICDSSDPVGPAEVLFKPEFFLSMRDALGPQGVLATQGECMWLHLDLISSVMKETRGIFSESGVKYAYTTIPTYPSGQIGFIVASKDPANDVSVPKRAPADEHKLRYYSNAIHKSAFVLPGRCGKFSLLLFYDSVRAGSYDYTIYWHQS